jgi:hypothetical protein
MVDQRREGSVDLCQVTGRHDGDHPRHLQSRRDIDAEDVGVRMRRPDDGDVETVERWEVVDESPRSRDETRVFASAHVLPV